MQNNDTKITFRAFLIGLLFAVMFAALTVFMINERGLYLTATQVPVLPFVLLFIMVLLINPVCRLLRFIRPFTPAEVLIVFIMGLVSSGLSSFGLAGPLVPVIGSLFNPSWNNEQTEWNRHIVPHLNENYFLAEKEISTAAARYADRFEHSRRLQRIITAADRLVTAAERVQSAEQQWRGATESSRDTVEDRLRIEREARHLEIARDNLQQLESHWETLREQHPDVPDAHATITRWRPKLEAAEAETEQSRRELASLEEKAFEKAELFRRGLPSHLRAYPGFIKLPEDTLSSYLARFRRTLTGHQAAGDARSVLDAIASERNDMSPAEIATTLQTLHQRLARMSDTEALQTALEETNQAYEQNNAKLGDHQTELRELHRSRREAHRDEIHALDRRINRAQRTLRGIQRDRERITEERDMLRRQLENLRLADDLERAAGGLAAAAADGSLPPNTGEILHQILEGLPKIDGDVSRFLLGDVPWRDWTGPLLRWSLAIGLTYLVLMTFNVLIFRQWAYNEKLIYPLAELPEFLAGHGAETGGIPSLFRGGLFWVGMGISGSFLGYNALVASQLIPGLDAVDLTNWWSEYIPDTPFQGLLGGRFGRSEIFFTMIGLSFLIPKKVSFSLWLFAVLSMIQVLVLVALGYGQNESSFPNELWFTLNFRTAQGGGALIVFSSVVLFKCRRFLLCAFSPGVLRDLPDDERRELRWSSFGFAGGSAGLILTLWLGMGVNPILAIAVYLLIMIITIGLIRAVAEGGILGFHCYTNPFHFLRTFFGLGSSWTSSAVIAPLLAYYAVLFVDLKTFIAPAMANSLKIRDDLKMRRGRFHLAVFAAIVCSAAVAVLYVIIMTYARGADMMGGWFHTGLPRSMFNYLADISRAPLDASPSDTGWVIAGGLTMVALLYFRQTVFWLPHPLGMVMLLNPIMGAYWFSILLGWAAKSMVTKYGNKQTYAHARTLFIGLIIGELLIVTIATIATISFDVTIPIDLNRN